MINPIQSNNLKSRATMIPTTNRCDLNQSVIPERFNTISTVTGPIMPDHFNTISITN